MSGETPKTATVPSGHRLARWLALRTLGVVHIAAFASFAAQYEGLVGSQGIAPAADWLSRAEQSLLSRGESLWLNVPTLGWWTGAEDGALAAMAWLGVALGVALTIGLLPRLVCGALWALYLSLFTLGGPFLSFQWDILLLEVTFLALFYAPDGLWPRPGHGEREPSPWAVWLMRFALFKLLFMSGVVKLTSNDPSWQDLTALDYHFWTQPLPHWVGWYAHQAPDWLREVGVMANHFGELFAPWLIVFNPRGWRLAAWIATVGVILLVGAGDLGATHVALGALAAAGLGGRVWPGGADASGHRAPAALITVGLMFGIAGTGNYGFFHLLTVVLVLTLLDDTSVRAVAPERLRSLLAPGPGPALRLGPRVLVIAAVAILIPMSALQMTTRLGRGAIRSAQAAERSGDPSLTQSLWLAAAETRNTVLGPVGSFSTINGYGLFASMTKSRYELLVEGSTDGREWRMYRFKYKPDTPDSPMPIVGLHMPRLDWQMWFAALRPRCRGGWMAGFIHSLLEGSPTVRALLAEDPFPDAPPRYVRIRRVSARFTDGAARDAADGAWWSFTPAGLYCQPLSLEAFRRGP